MTNRSEAARQVKYDQPNPNANMRRYHGPARDKFTGFVFESPIYDYNLICRICDQHRGWHRPGHRNMLRIGVIQRVDVTIDGKFHGCTDVVDGTCAKMLLGYCRLPVAPAVLVAFGLDRINLVETATPLECLVKAVPHVKRIAPFHIDGMSVTSYLPDLNIVLDAALPSEERQRVVVGALGCRYIHLTHESVFDVIGVVTGANTAH